MKKQVLEIIEASYHRNGIGGAGFTAILFKDHEEKKTMIASLFEEPGYCAVYAVDELTAGNITFAHGNSWRGDRYETLLRQLLETYQREKGTGQMGPFSFVPPDTVEAIITKNEAKK